MHSEVMWATCPAGGIRFMTVNEVEKEAPRAPAPARRTA